MEVIKFSGWVEKIFDADQYKQEIVVTNYEGEDDKNRMLQDFKDKKSNDYPTALKFQASIKSGASAQLDCVKEGDKVDVQYCISGRSGVSKKTGNYYCINELNICKKDGIVVTKRSDIQSSVNEVQDDDNYDVPF